MKGKQNNKQRKSARKSRPRGVGVGQAGPFPATMVRVLNYSDTYTLTEAGAGTGAAQVFRTSDLYDPDFTNVGHQPMYFDQLCTSTGPYLLFTVPSASFEMRFSNVSSFPVLIVANFQMVNTVPTNRITASEREYSWKHLLAPNGSGNSTIQKTLAVDNVRLVGVPKPTFEGTYQGTASASSPSPSLCVSVWGVGGIGSVVFQVNAKYRAKFFQLGPIATS